MVLDAALHDLGLRTAPVSSGAPAALRGLFRLLAEPDRAGPGHDSLAVMCRALALLNLLEPRYDTKDALDLVRPLASPLAGLGDMVRADHDVKPSITGAVTPAPGPIGERRKVPAWPNVAGEDRPGRLAG